MTNTFKVASVFSDNMVLQREGKIHIWGEAEENDKIEIEFCGQHKEAIAKDGIWKITLDSLNAGGPFNMFIKNKSNEITLKDILIGDVFVAAGQSNMEFKLKDSTIEKEEILSSNYPNIRLYTVPQIEYEDENKRIPDLEEGKWQVCSSETVEEFSAVGYYFAKKLHENLNVPIGIISCNKGGTSASCWMDEEYLLRDAEIKKSYIDEYLKAVNGLSEEEEDKRTNEYMRVLEEYSEKLDEYKRKNPGISLSKLKSDIGHTPWPPPLGRKSYLRPCGLYKTMLKKIVPYGVKAIIWYQGEEDTKYSELYKKLFSLLIENWRREWHNNNLPFIFVQLPGYDDEIINSWAVLREAQLSVMKETNNCDMIVTIDCGEEHNLHPVNKKPVGERLALLARDVIYNENLNGYSPIYKSMKLKDDKITISFNYAGKQELVIKDGDTLNGFEVRGSDNKFIKVKGKILNKSSVIIDCKGINEPRIVRYAWANYAEINLYNKNGLPASPFIDTIY